MAWLADRPARLRERVLVQHGTALVQGMITGITGVLDITLPGGTLESSIVPGDSLALNDIGVVYGAARPAASGGGLRDAPPHGRVCVG